MGLARPNHTLCVLLVHKLDIPGDKQKSDLQMLLDLDVLSLAHYERSLDKDLTWWVHFQILLKFTVWVYWDPSQITLLMINTLHFLRITK